MPGPPLSARVARPKDLSGTELETWERLCLEGPRRAFLSPHFTAAAARARSDVSCLVLSHADGAPAGFLPFQFGARWRSVLRAAEPVGGELSDGFGAVLEPGLTVEVERLLRDARLAALDFHHLVPGQDTVGLRGEESEPGLRVAIPDGFDAFWTECKQQSKKFVQKTERRERNLVRELGPLRLETSGTAADLDELIERKRDQYARTGVRDVLAEPWKQELLRALLRTERRSCAGSFLRLFAGDTWIASHFGLTCGDVLHYWFPVYNPEVHNHSPGHLLLKAILERCAELGIACVDRGAGDTPAKRSFANEEQGFGRGVWRRRGPRSTLYRLACSARWRVASLGERS